MNGDGRQHTALVSKARRYRVEMPLRFNSVTRHSTMRWFCVASFLFRDLRGCRCGQHTALDVAIGSSEGFVAVVQSLFWWDVIGAQSVDEVVKNEFVFLVHVKRLHKLVFRCSLL